MGTRLGTAVGYGVEIVAVTAAGSGALGGIGVDVRTRADRVAEDRDARGALRRGSHDIAGGISCA